ncbi:SGNH/GDSL hydrolase family protein [Actinoplanes sp. G11-F43]|uniref:SGNH/GDSL hydrolase family protein n=1 Tax=Actinoplanes sp. G11-F43 TaxID=3424130 RepID=UPI003D3416E3
MNRLYVALGDSMSIDDYAGGPGRGAAGLLHTNRDREFPGWAGRDLATDGWRTQILARDGAVTADVLTQIGQLHTPADLVTITMGGNDLLAAYGDDTAAAHAVARAEAQAEGVLSRLRRHVTPSARIVVTTVYDPSDGTGMIPGSGLAPWPKGPDWIRTLNQALTSVAARHNALPADAHTHFHGHGVTAGDPSQSSPAPTNPDLWFCGVVEPNAHGAHHIRTVWWNTLFPAAHPDPGEPSPP